MNTTLTSIKPIFNEIKQEYESYMAIAIKICNNNTITAYAENDVILR